MKSTVRPLRLGLPLRASVPARSSRRALSTSLPTLKDKDNVATSKSSEPQPQQKPSHPREKHTSRSRPTLVDQVPWLAKQPLHPLSLADLVKYAPIPPPPIDSHH